MKEMQSFTKNVIPADVPPGEDRLAGGLPRPPLLRPPFVAEVKKKSVGTEDRFPV